MKKRGFSGARAVLVLLMAPMLARAAEADMAADVRYDIDIRPIFSQKCFGCHGPDEESRQADLRLDLEDGLFGDRGGYHSVVPGNLDDSELYRRITSDDESERMPPPDSDHQLTAEEIQLIARWIESGAKWQQHWAFRAPERPPLPEVQGAAWVRTPMDRFVLARLEAEGLSPSPEANRRTLLRRVTFDLTGLPPRLEDVHAFLADQSPDAYEKVVDRLLSSGNYGEHLARYWLDVARYADTHGLHLDNYREMWPYRDWVIRAFNENLPYDKFVTYQIGGDLLPDATLEQQVASGFNRCHVTTNEGGSIAEEVYVRNVIERVDGLGTAFLGLTVGCAVCHDHKYDPISQKEFYQLFAFFNNLDGPEMDGNVKDSAPSVRVPTEDEAARIASLSQELDRWRADRQQRLHVAESERDGFADWLAEHFAPDKTSQASEALEIADGLVVHCKLDEGSGATVADSRDAKDPPRVVGEPQWVEGRIGGAVEITADSYVDLGERGRFKETEAFSYGAWVRVPAQTAGAIIARTETKEGVRGYDVTVLKDGRVSALLSGRWPGYAIKVNTKTPVLPPDTWHHVFVTYDGSRLVDGVALYVDGELQPVDVISDSLKQEASINSSKPLLLGRRETGAILAGGHIDDARLYNRRLTDAEILAIYLGTQLQPIVQSPRETRTDEQIDMLSRFYAVRNDPVYGDLTAEMERLRKEMVDIGVAMATTLVFREARKPRPAFLLVRGQYDQRSEEVERETPAFLPPMPDDLPRDRLGLAKWLISPEHPLTARVAVNRFWQQLFGSGLVKTAEDFGSQGSPPSHPELLDWLAVEFRENGWNVKALLKQIVTSATYRQSSRSSQELVDRDPENLLLARGPRFRLDAEMLRDQALAVSGLLVSRVGGPSVKPPQPADLWYAVGYSGSNTVKFVADEGPDKVFRRSVYTFWKRTSPPPQLSTFDAPSRESCVARRERTNTPLQALLLMNEPQYIEAARHFAERILKDAPSSSTDRIQWMFERLTMRPATEVEVETLSRTLDDFQAEYNANPEAARKLIAIGELAPDTSIDPVELAAWTMMTNVMFNLDEMITKE